MTAPDRVSTLAETSLQVAMSGSGSSAVKLFLFITVLSFASALVISLSSFARIAIVFSFVRQGLGTPSLPPNQVLLGLAAALTAFVMAPTARVIYRDALSPYLNDAMGPSEAVDAATVPLREFMERQTRTEDLRLFLDASGTAAPAQGEALPMTVVVPAFMVSELTTAFRMGLFVYVPLVLIDLLVASLLMSLGMMMVPPTMISLPIKVGVFLIADGWHLLAAALMRSF